MARLSISLGVIILVVILTACASHPSSNVATNNPGVAVNSVAIPSTSPFSKIKTGMSQKQVHDLIGDPTDSANHSTGKAFIPFYFGSDVMRWEDLYKGQGPIQFGATIAEQKRGIL